MSDIKNIHSTEVMIIGGSYSGMAAAMTLGRALRQVVVLDAGEPCNRFAPHAHNFLGSDGVPPMEIHKGARKQLLQYPSVKLLADKVTDVRRQQTGFIIHTASGNDYLAEKVLLATGLKDELPDIPGIRECWGKSAIHCPYCHGYEFKGGKTGVLATSGDALHIISLLKQWTSDLQVFTNETFRFNEAASAFMAQQKIPVVSGKIKSLDHDNGQIKNILLQSSGHPEIEVPLQVLYVLPPVKQALDLQQQLNYQLTPAGHIQVDEARHTSVNGLYAAGDNSSRFRSLSTALATGMTAGAMINFDLVNEKRPLPDMQ